MALSTRNRRCSMSSRRFLRLAPTSHPTKPPTSAPSTSPDPYPTCDASSAPSRAPTSHIRPPLGAMVEYWLPAQPSGSVSFVQETMQIRDKFFIGGRWIAPHGRETIEVHNAGNGEVMGRVPAGDVADA